MTGRVGATSARAVGALSVAPSVVPLTHDVTGASRARKLALAPYLTSTAPVAALRSAGRVGAIDVARLERATQFTIRSAPARAIAVRALAHAIRIFSLAVDVTRRLFTNEITGPAPLANAIALEAPVLSLAGDRRREQGTERKDQTD
jgi:hypothetical protein